MNARVHAPARHSRSGEAAIQLRKLEALGDRRALAIFWQAVAAAARPARPAGPFDQREENTK